MPYPVTCFTNPAIWLPNKLFVWLAEQLKAEWGYASRRQWTCSDPIYLTIHEDEDTEYRSTSQHTQPQPQRVLPNSIASQPTTIDRSQPNLVGRYITCPQTRVSLFGCPVSHTLGAKGKYAKFRLFPTRILATANVTHRAI